MRCKSIGHFWAHTCVKLLVQAGVTTFCIAPGARSTCLVLAINDLPDIDIVTHYDERSLAFFALGVAKDKHKPVVVITTSGSAVANLIPAAVEAFNLHIPLVFITADRPKELHGCGANQVLNQEALLQSCTMHQFFMPAPSTHAKDKLKFEEQLKSCVGCLIDGPMHINFPFREPFIETSFSSPIEFDLKQDSQMEASNFAIIKNRHKPPQKLDLVDSNSRTILSSCFNSDRAQKVLVIAANTVKPIDTDQFITWAKTHNLPVIAECTSSLPWIDSVGRQIDLIIERLKEHDLLPDSIICVGAKWISKTVHQLLKSVKNTYLCHDFAESQNWLKLDSIEVHYAGLDILNILPNIDADINYYNDVSAIVSAQRSASLKKSNQTLDETFYIQHLNSFFESCQRLFLGNSLSVRLVNNFSNMSSEKLVSMTQRGVSGIDGLISSVAGIAYSCKGLTGAVIGDLSALYDLNGFYFLSRLTTPVVIVVLNNNGGRIFESLPIKDETMCEKLFVMPHNLTLKEIAKGFNVNYKRVKNKKDLNQLLTELKEIKMSLVVECMI